MERTTQRARENLPVQVNPSVLRSGAAEERARSPRCAADLGLQEAA